MDSTSYPRPSTPQWLLLIRAITCKSPREAPDDPLLPSQLAQSKTLTAPFLNTRTLDPLDPFIHSSDSIQIQGQPVRILSCLDPSPSFYCPPQDPVLDQLLYLYLRSKLLGTHAHMYTHAHRGRWGHLPVHHHQRNLFFKSAWYSSHIPWSSPLSLR